MAAPTSPPPLAPVLPAHLLQCLCSLASWLVGNREATQIRHSPGHSPFACFNRLSLRSVLLCFSLFEGLSESFYPEAITQLLVTTFQCKT